MEPVLNSPLGRGSIELGIILSSVLFGVLIVQCYIYHQANFKDDWLIRTLVSACYANHEA